MTYGRVSTDARGYVNARGAAESAREYQARRVAAGADLVDHAAVRKAGAEGGPRWYADTYREQAGPFPTQSAAAIWVEANCVYAGPIVTRRGSVHVGRDGTVYCGRGSSRLTLGRVYRGGKDGRP